MPRTIYRQPNIVDTDIDTTKNFKVSPRASEIPIDEPEGGNLNFHYFDTKSLIWSQIFFENLSMSIAMNIGIIEFL